MGQEVHDILPPSILPSNVSLSLKLKTSIQSMYGGILYYYIPSKWLKFENTGGDGEKKDSTLPSLIT